MADAENHQEGLEASQIKAARAAGYSPLKRGYYGGKQLQIGERVFAKEAVRAKSKSQWGREGFRIKEGGNASRRGAWQA